MALRGTCFRGRYSQVGFIDGDEICDRFISRLQERRQRLVNGMAKNPCSDIT